MSGASDAASPPRTRWARLAAGWGGTAGGYAATFARLVAEGADVDGEARLADALLPRAGRVLDVGSGMGRVAAALAARGHEVVAVDPDPGMVAQARGTYPDLRVLEADVLEVDADRLGAEGLPTSFDLAVCVGNTLAYTADGTERAVLARIADLLAPTGRVLSGHHVTGRPEGARAYPVETLAADAEAAGLLVQHHFGSYELHPPGEGYAVVVLALRTPRAPRR